VSSWLVSWRRVDKSILFCITHPIRKLSRSLLYLWNVNYSVSVTVNRLKCWIISRLILIVAETSFFIFQLVNHHILSRSLSCHDLLVWLRKLTEVDFLVFQLYRSGYNRSCFLFHSTNCAANMIGFFEYYTPKSLIHFVPSMIVLSCRSDPRVWQSISCTEIHSINCHHFWV
jgi:hypothetical protein